MRFEVPQFIEIEDKIIGPLTWKQFVYVGGGVGILVLLYMFLPFFFFIIFGIPFGALAFFLAFHKINNRPFSIFLESAFNYITKHKLYLWRKDREQSITQTISRQPRIPQDVSGVDKKSISALSHSLEHHVPE